MFNPSFCQELSKHQSAHRHPNFSSGIHSLLVGDKRGARKGQARPSQGISKRLVGYKRQSPTNQPGAKEPGKEREKTQKRRFNTHFPMSDLNNREVAELMYEWLCAEGLN